MTAQLARRPRHPRRYTPRRPMHHFGRANADAGSVTIEAILILPLVLISVLGIVAAGRGTHAATMVAAAAHDAARAASIDRDPAAARADATRTALGSLHRGGTSCHTATVSVDTSAFAPGGVVTVRVTCHVALGSLGLPGIPGDIAIARSGRSPLDQYRGVNP